MLKKLPIAAAATIVLLAAAHAHAQLAPAIAGCEELRAGARKPQADACVAYAPCNTVLQAYGTCEKAAAFMDRLLGGGKPKALTAEVVFEANAPEGKLNGEWQEQFRQMRERMKAAGSEVLTGKSSDGSTWVYEGGVRDGKSHGFGYYFWSDGNAFRGQLENGSRSGPGDYVAPNGFRIIGQHRGNRLEGEGLRRDRTGNSYKGTFVGGKLEGKALLVFAGGETYEGMFRNDLRDGPGKVTTTNGATLTGKWFAGKLNGQATYTDSRGNSRVRVYSDGEMVSESPVGGAPALATTVPAAPTTAPAAPADPIAAARESCAADENRCQKVCAGIGALGVFSALRGRNTDQASAQLTECTSRCTSEKSACDLKVAAMERPRAPAAPSGTAVAGTTTSSTSTTGANAAAPSVPPNASVAEAVAAMKDYPSAGKTMCEAAGDKWRDLDQPTAAQDFERYGWLKYGGTNAMSTFLQAEYNLQFMKRCAKSQAEYDERTQYIRQTHQRFKERLANCQRQDDSCQKPAGFDEWFARYTRNAEIALEWARTAKAPPPPTKEEEACRAEIWSWEMLKRDRESTLPKDSVVRLSEINIWFMERSMDTIQRLCPNSERYRKDYEVAKATLPQAVRVCSQMASAPPCVARLDPDKPAFKPAAAPASAPKPTASAPAAAGPQSGASWVKSTVDFCRADGGTPVVGECIRCDNPGRGWTKCPAGSSGVNSMQ